MFHLLLSFASCFAAKSIAAGEWDVYAGTSVGYDPHVLYSFEFHEGKKGTIATLWRSDDPTNQPTFKFADGRIAQIAIEFGKSNSGTFMVKDEIVHFQFDEDSGLPSATFTVGGVHYELRIIKEDVIEITIGEVEYVAMLQEQIQVMEPTEVPTGGVSEQIQEKFNTFMVTFLTNLSIFCERFGEHEQHVFYGILICILNILIFIMWKLLKCMCCRPSKTDAGEEEHAEEEEPAKDAVEEEEVIEEVAKEKDEEDEVAHRKNCCE